ncbi:uncharacterized protein LOC110228501 [Arabidopsis lyrata subsp. lyrata]|uniref:uncharacterized protein LOC110228501 n=1 Tax=Arabidopsis lyrata subsp. lyrata TaxID=81972 RepID=UPI000A29D66C|nr:uncharacterized protein LOC110228501 [Arabidopsis lyrata subsp. lyrata]|eukprot:XP_020881808.1 uncharacterized protein LOC110228501 [Arabidopsis lyrata subsp. lyrata]
MVTREGTINLHKRIHKHFLQEEGSKSDEEDRKSFLKATEKTDVDLELWKENSETLFNKVLVKFKDAKKTSLDEVENPKNTATRSKLLLGEQCKATQQKGSRELMRRHRDVMVIKRGHHKRMLTSEKNGAQEDAYLGEKWSISRLKSKPKTT